MKFSRLARITEKHITEEIVKSLKELGIPVEDMRGQGYDAPPPQYVQPTRRVSDTY